MSKISDRFSRKSDAEWVTWLSDDSPPQDVQTEVQRRASQLPNRNAQSAELPRERLESVPIVDDKNKAKDVSIQIHIKWPSPPVLPKLPYKRIGLISVSVLIVGAAGFVATNKLSNYSGSGSNNSKTSQTAGVPLDFKPLAPKDKMYLASTDDTQLARYDDKHQVYSYNDSFLGIPLTVNQQKIPDALASSKDPASDVAAKMQADNRVNTAFGTAYFATDAKTGSQRLVFSYKDRLVFIQSSFKRDAESWKVYIESLRPS